MTNCPIARCTAETRVSAILCDEHAVQVWHEVEFVKGTAASITPDAATPNRPAAEAQEWIYYVQLDEKIKIGWTANFAQRMKAYPPHAKVITKHPGTRADERDLHRTFTPSRASGREWYHPTPELLAHIEQAKAAEAQRLFDAHMDKLTASGIAAEAMEAEWPGSSRLRMYRDDPLSIG